MNPVCRDEVSTRPAGADFTLRLHREINFILARRNNFSPGFYLDWYIFKKFLFGRMSVYENSSIQKQAPEAFSIQKTNHKSFAIFTENTCFGVILLKRGFNAGFPVDVVKSFESTYFEEHLPTTASADSG